VAPDAVVIGSGPNGLVAANLLADRGWSVLVLEEQPELGGAVRSGEITAPGYVSDLFSAFYPLAAASKVIQGLDLDITWRRSPYAVAHPLEDGSCAVISTDLEETCALLDAQTPGDGDGWRRLYDLYELIGQDLVDALMTPFPPVASGARIAGKLNTDLVRFARFGLLPVRRLADETFKGEHGKNLLSGNALHADLSPVSAGGGLFGWLLCGLGQRHGFPVPEGGAGRLTQALARRLRSRGGDVQCGQRVTKIALRGGRAAGVRTADGELIGAERAVLADTGAPQLYLELLDDIPSRLRTELRDFEYDWSTVKVDWALRAPIPWKAEGARRAGTIHLAEGLEHLSTVTGDIVAERLPERPFLVLGQYSMVDDTRMPPGAESAWAYTHVAYESWDESRTREFVERMENEVERRAPGFRDLIVGRHVFTPDSLERANRNLVRGAINGGTAQLHQQVIFRPTPSSMGRPETPVKGLYLASASAHPGGGVHGGAGANAARAAIAHDRLRRLTVSLLPRGRGRGPRPSR
jgi:phytoene dehydrogenase-like protein